MLSLPLRAFDAVARHGSFSAAARSLGKTQSAISQTVARLEDRLGTALFSRGRGGARITDAGRILLEHTTLANRELETAVRRLSALGPLEDGRLIIATSDTLGCYFLPTVLARFREQHPRVEVQLRTSPSPRAAGAVAHRDADLGVVSLPLPESVRIGGRPLSQLVHIESLSRHQDVLVMKPGHRLATRKRVPLAHLDGENLLLLGSDTAGRQTLDRAFAARGVTPNVVMEMNSVELLKRMVQLGFGAAVVPAMAVERERRQGELIAATIIELSGTSGDHDNRRSIGLVLPTDPVLPQAARVFAEMLRH